MAENTEQLLIEVQIDADEAIKESGKLTSELAELRDETTKLKQAQAEARKEGQTNTDEYKRRSEQIAINEARVKNLSNALNNNQKIIRASTNDVKSEVGAYQQLQNNYALAAQRAKDLSVAYGENSEQARKAVATAKQMSDRLKEVDASVGQNQRNVGNYSSVLTALPGGFQGVVQGATNVKGAFNALSATPLLGILQLVIMVAMGISKAFNNNEEQTNKLKAAFAPLGAVTDALARGFEQLVEGLIKSVEWVGKMIAAAGRLLGIQSHVNETTKAYIQLEKDKQALIIQTRQTNEQAAESDLKVSELRANAVRKDLFSAKERLAFLKQAVALEKQTAKSRTDIAKENLRILEEEAKRSRNAAQFNDKLSEAKIAVINAEREYFNKTRELGGQITAFIAEEEAARAKLSADARTKRLADQQDEIKAMEINLRIQQATVQEITEESAMNTWMAEKAINDRKRAYGLMSQEEYNLALIESEKRYNETVMGLVEDVTAEMQKLIDDDIATQRRMKDEARALELERINTDFQNRLELSRASLDAEAEMQKEALRRKQAEEIASAEKTGADISLINQKYAQAEIEIDAKKNEAKRAAASQLLGFVADAFGKATTAGKIAASAQIAIDTYSGAFSAFTGMVKTFPGPWGLVAGGVASAAVAAGGIKAIANVWKVKEGQRTVSRSSMSAASIPSPPAGSRGINSTIANQSAGQSGVGAVRSGVAAGIAENPIVPVLVTNDLTKAERQRVVVREGAML